MAFDEHRDPVFDERPPPGDGWEFDSYSSPAIFRAVMWQRNVAEGCMFALRASENHLDSGHTVDRGFLLALADHTVGSVMLGLSGTAQVTVSLNIQFMSAAKAGDLLISRSQVVQNHDGLFFLSGTIEVDGHLVAKSQGIWKQVRPIT